MKTNFASYIWQYFEKRNILNFCHENQFWARKPRCCESESIYHKEPLATLRSPSNHRAHLKLAWHQEENSSPVKTLLLNWNNTACLEISSGTFNKVVKKTCVNSFPNEFIDIFSMILRQKNAGWMQSSFLMPVSSLFFLFHLKGQLVSFWFPKNTQKKKKKNKERSSKNTQAHILRKFTTWQKRLFQTTI